MRLYQSTIIVPGFLVVFMSYGLSDAVGAEVLAPLSRPSIAAARIDTANAPTIDGDLSDLAWAQATVIDEFLQVEPDTGAPATERTVLRIMYDENNLYFGVYAYDSEPDQIVVRSMARDGQLGSGDNISIVLDPGLTRRNAYSFQTGPSGGRGDSLILNNSEELEEWDPIWDVRTRLVVDGWVAEIAIPFRSLSYEADQPDWGFDFSRTIRRKNEDVQWAVQNPALFFLDVSQAGTLTGMRDINRGLGLDIQIYGVTHVKRDWHIPGDDVGISFTAGGNAFYSITPALTGTLTYNPDFSDTPLDARQVNTTRFSLFFPETRDFFLQDAGAFEFGGRGFGRGFDRSANNGRPFFSRNIGLADRETVSIIGGGKLSGTYAGFGIGAFTALTADTANSSGQLLSVARIIRPVLAESRAGIILTHGDPTGETENTVVGADFQYRNSDWLGGGIFQSDFYYERSFSSALDEDDAYGVAINYPNEPWGWEFGFKEIGANFEPALGFVNRPGIRTYDGSIAHLTRFRDYFLRTIEVGAASTFVTDLHNRLESRESEFAVEIEAASEDDFQIELSNTFENIPDGEDFDVADIPVPAGRYDWTNINVSYRGSQGRPLQVVLGFSCCSFFDGDAIETQVELNFRPSEFFEISTEWEATYLDMPNGKVDIHVMTIESAINFTPDVTLELQAQYDNISEEFGFLSRFRWLFAPGSELFISFGQAAVIPGGRFEAERSAFSVRLGHTLRL